MVRKQIKKHPLTWVCPNWGFSAKFEHWNSIEHLCRIEHLCFDFPNFAKPKPLAVIAERHQNRQVDNKTLRQFD